MSRSGVELMGLRYEAERLVRQGESRADVARMLGVHPQTLAGWALKDGWRKKDLDLERSGAITRRVIRNVAAAHGWEREKRAMLEAQGLAMREAIGLIAAGDGAGLARLLAGMREEEIRRRFPDFIVIAPSIGVIVIEARLAAAFVLRAFLQHTIDEYMHANRIPFRENDRQGRSQELNLGQRAERVLDHLVANNRASNQDLRGVRTTLTGRTDPASIQSLNDYNHSRYRMPDADSLRNAWDGAEPLFIAVYGAAS